MGPLQESGVEELQAVVAGIAATGVERWTEHQGCGLLGNIQRCRMHTIFHGGNSMATQMPQREAVIVAALRTPIGLREGKLKEWHPVDLMALVLAELVKQSGIDAGLVEDVIVGCVVQVGEQSLNVGRNAVLAAGFPETVPGTTVDRQCGSSQQAIHFAAQGVLSGAYDVVIAGGVE